MALREELLRPDAFAGVASTEAVTLVETHISWVFLLDHDVFKVKKPVDLGFLDFRTLDQRLRACQEEVRLNSRLAPGVYVGIAAVRRGSDGMIAVGGEGELVDWAVHMVRLADEDRADTRVDAGNFWGQDVDRIAARLAAFHAKAATGPAVDAFGESAAVGRNVAENFEQTRSTLTGYLTPAEAEEIERWQTAFVRDRDALFAKRIVQGRVRDGHGDLRLEHVYLGREGIRIIDCIEFNDRFRYGDACADVAFLAMDLAAHARVDLAERLLATYAREADDYDLYSMVDFYGSYRAFVRGKVATILTHDESVAGEVRERAAAEARKFFRLALSFERPALLPARVVAVGGVIASGKSTVASELGVELDAPVIESDRTRKAMLGVSPVMRMSEAAWSGAYSAETTDRVYEEVFRRAGVVLASGRSVVLDASFRTEDLRRRARDLAACHRVPFWFVECVAPRDVCLSRLAEREHGPSVSDGRQGIFDEFRKTYEPSGATPESERVQLDTTRPMEKSLALLRTRLGVSPAGLRG